jgi:exonuclease SbcC
MIIQSLKLINFQLFKEAEINFSKTNLITGINFDSEELDSSFSGNGAGKTSIINGLLFVLFGEVTNLTLKDLIRIEEKECSVICEITNNNEHYRIIRKIPSNLEIYSDKGEHKFSTQTIAQKFINELIGEDLNHFRMYRTIDQTKGINLLDLGIVSLRKNLMDIVNNQFIEIRNNLLAKKLERERFSVTKKLYHFYISTKREEILNNGLLKLNSEESNILKDKREQEKAINDLSLKIKNNETQTINLTKMNQDYVKKSIDIEKKINNYQIEIKELQNTETKPIEKIDYDLQITKIEKEISELDKKLQNKENEESTKSTIEKIIFAIHDLETDINDITKDNDKLIKEIEGLNQVQIGTKCDRCGSLVSKEYKEAYENDKANKLQSNKISINNLQEKINTEKELLISTEKELDKIKKERIKLEFELGDLRKTLKLLNTQKAKYNEELMMTSKIESGKQKYEELIKLSKEQIIDYEKQTKDNNKIIEQLTLEIEQSKFKLKEEESCLNYYNSLYEEIQNNVRKTKEYLMKLNEAKKFSSYKYTKSDIQLYADAIKTLDSFSAYYVMEWLNNLSLIINNLLKPINISVEFSIEKDFIKVNNAGQELKYEQLSSGQKTFLNTIFKVGILMNEGIHDGLLVIDEGINTCDQISFNKLLEIINNLNFQSIIIYQNCSKEIKEINYINTERKNGESKIK